MEIGRKVRTIRGNLTQVEFARRLGTSQPVISDVERGGEPSKRLAKKLAAYAGLPVSEFLTREDNVFTTGILLFRGLRN